MKEIIFIKWKPNFVWFIVAFILSMTIDGNTNLISIFQAVLGRFYIIYWLFSYYAPGMFGGCDA